MSTQMAENSPKRSEIRAAMESTTDLSKMAASILQMPPTQMFTRFVQLQLAKVLGVLSQQMFLAPLVVGSGTFS